MTQGPLRLRGLLERLAREEIRFVLVGGLAVNAWGYLRATRDVDIVPDPAAANLARLTRMLEDLDGRVEVADGTLGRDAIATFLAAGDRTLVSTSLGELDVLQGLPQIPRYADLDESARDADLGGVSVRVCSLDALLAMKRASERTRDQDDLEALEAAHDPSE